MTLLTTFLLSACGAESDENSPPFQISGTAFKGPVNGALVVAYNENDLELGRTTTNSEGQYSITHDQPYFGVIKVDVSGGRYIDEASLLQVTLTDTFRAVSVSKGNGGEINITPLTELATRYFEAQPSPSEDSVVVANNMIAAAFGLEGDIVGTVPVNLLDADHGDVSGVAVNYALVIAGITEVVQSNIDSNNQSADSLAEVMSKLDSDLRDNGVLDDQTLVQQVAQGIQNFIASDNNQSQVILEGSRIEELFYIVSQQVPLSFRQPETVSKFYGDAPFINALQGGSGTGAVSYSSNSAAVVSVDSNTGEVTIIGAGTASITVTKAADSDYHQSTANFNIVIGQCGYRPTLRDLRRRCV